MGEKFPLLKSWVLAGQFADTVDLHPQKKDGFAVGPSNLRMEGYTITENAVNR